MRSIWNVGFAGAGALFFLTIGILVVNSRERLHAPLQEVRTPVEELQKDAEDLALLIATTKRTENRILLEGYAKRLSKQIHRQEDLIMEGNRVSEAALRHLRNKEFSQARLELGAAKSTYQRVAAVEKVEWILQLERQLSMEEDEHNKQMRLIASGDPLALANPRTLPFPKTALDDQLVEPSTDAPRTNATTAEDMHTHTNAAAVAGVVPPPPLHMHKEHTSHATHTHVHGAEAHSSSSSSSSMLSSSPTSSRPSAFLPRSGQAVLAQAFPIAPLFGSQGLITKPPPPFGGVL